MLHLQAISGQAIDRHLLGLKMQATEEKLSVPALFRDPAYSKALHYHLSTSQVWQVGRKELLGICHNKLNVLVPL